MDYKELHNKSIVVDGHSDIPLDLYKKRNRNKKNIIKTYHLPLLKEGGLDLIFVNLFCNFHPEGSLKEAMIQVSTLYEELREIKDIILIETKEDLQKVRKKEKIGFILSMEGLEPISNDIVILEGFYRLGLRSAALTWNYRNYFASGVGEVGGLSNMGKRAVKKMEKLGIIVDVSHLNEEGFWDIIHCTKRPIIASHSNAKGVFNHRRNLTDRQIKAIAETGGVIGINSQFTSSNEKENLSTFMEQLEYILNIAGEDHVGLGFDFNFYFRAKGLDGLNDYTYVPKITEEMFKKGYSVSTIKKVLGENYLRILNEVLV